MDVLVWIAEATWQACMEAVAEHVPQGSRVTLLHVVDPTPPGPARGAGTGLLGGQGRGRRDPRADEGDLAQRLGREVLDSAARCSAQPVSLHQRTGRVEREVVAEADGKDLLILARDGDISRLGPRSIGPATRFVLDHAPCATLLVWPDRAPNLRSIPPLPDHARPRHP